MFKYIALVIAAFYSFLAMASVDLNTASPKDLEALPGVGSVIAKAIIAARPFKAVEDLKKVKGIGEAKYPQIAPLVMVQAAAPKPLVQGERININKASLEELARLPGIGMVKAKEIVKARPFNAPEDILRVKGIAPATYAKLKDSISTQ